MENTQVAEKRDTRNTLIKILIVILAAVLIITVVRPYVTDQKTYAYEIDYLDKKMANANMLALGASSASFVVSMLPDDTGTAISNELADFTGYLMVVISAIFLEKYLLVTIGWIGFVISLLSCVLFVLAIIAKDKNKMKFKEYAIRTLIFSICIVCIIPLGCACGDSIERINEESINRALDQAKNANEIVESMPDEQDKNFFQKVGDFFAGLWESAKQAYEWAKSVLNSFMASIAVMLVTTIAIPILMFFCFIWAIRFLTKHDFVVAVVGIADRVVDGTRKTITSGRRTKKVAIKNDDEQ